MAHAIPMFKSRVDVLISYWLSLKQNASVYTSRHRSSSPIGRLLPDMPFGETSVHFVPAFSTVNIVTVFRCGVLLFVFVLLCLLLSF